MCNRLLRGVRCEIGGNFENFKLLDVGIDDDDDVEKSQLPLDQDDRMR